MSFLSRLADRLIMQPTTHYIDPEDREQKWFEGDGFKIEAWVVRQESASPLPQKLLMLKFPGSGGRAERARAYPAHLWPNIETETWTINHRGYGQSTAPGSIQNFAETCELVWNAAREQFPDRKIMVYGNSLGCLSALYLAARYSPAAIYVRNPPPLAQMVATRPKYAWWNFGMSKFIANQVPDELDSVENAKRSTCPALFVCSEKDRVIPPKYQQLVIDAYGGDLKKFTIAGADHHHRIGEEQEAQYLETIVWLGSRFLDRQ